MRRLILFAIVLSALMWTAAARATSARADDTLTMSGVESWPLPGDSHGPSDSGKQWQAAQHTIAAGTESAWKYALIHAELAGSGSPRVFDPSASPGSPDRPVRSAPHYLRHAPLLI